MPLVFTNTRTKKKEVFKPLKDNLVRIYSCGPTVYNVAHIGNFMSYIDADLIQRYLRFWKRFDVTWVMNITDVDDKTIRDSRKKYPELNPKDALLRFTREYEDLFFEDLAAVGIDTSHVSKFPRATDHILQMQDLIRKIDAAGFAYQKGNSVYFDVMKYHAAGHYGELLNIDFSGFTAGSRIDADEYAKDHVQDFVLWKGMKEGEPSWDFDFHGSNLPGRPGWHIECSAMSSTYLGTTFDIHTGGVDLIFPHHENEIAQSTAGNGVRHADMWLHNEHLQVDGAKMAKSKGNFYSLRDSMKRGYSGKEFRMCVASGHYRSKLNFTFESMDAAREKIERVNELIRKLQRVNKDRGSTLTETKYAKQIENALDDDLNTPEALAVLFGAVRDLNSSIETCTVTDAKRALQFLSKVNDVFGVFSFEHSELDALSQKLIEEREQARKNKEFARSDELRKKLLERGIVVEDTPEGSVWKRL